MASLAGGRGWPMVFTPRQSPGTDRRVREAERNSRLPSVYFMIPGPRTLLGVQNLLDSKGAHGTQGEEGAKHVWGRASIMSSKATSVERTS